MAIKLVMTDARNQQHIMNIAKFEFGVSNTYVDRIGKSPKQRVELINEGGRFHIFTFIHDLDLEAIKLQRALNKVFQVEMWMKEAPDVGKITYVHLKFTAKLTMVETKPIALFASDTAYHIVENKMGQVVTLTIDPIKEVLFESDVPKHEKGKIAKDKIISANVIK